MPFTLSHAAAAYPLRRTRLELSALITGCFAPDFPYFIFLRPHGGFIGHTFTGVFTFDLPAGLLAVWLFEIYMKRPLMVFLPAAVRQRLEVEKRVFSFLPPARTAWITISILIGTATHLLWDSFTHPYRPPYRPWRFLSLPVHLPFGRSIEAYQLLQHGSTLIGFLILAIWVLRWYQSTRPADPPVLDGYTRAQRLSLRFIVPGLALCGGVLRAFLGVGIPASRQSAVDFLVELGVATISFFALGVLACGVIFRRGGAIHARG
jgi:hypothetical protein